MGANLFQKPPLHTRLIGGPSPFPPEWMFQHARYAIFRYYITYDCLNVFPILHALIKVWSQILVDEINTIFKGIV